MVEVEGNHRRCFIVLAQKILNSKLISWIISIFRLVSSLSLLGIPCYVSHTLTQILSFAYDPSSGNISPPIEKAINVANPFFELQVHHFLSRHCHEGTIHRWWFSAQDSIGGGFLQLGTRCQKWVGKSMQIRARAIKYVNAPNATHSNPFWCFLRFSSEVLGVENWILSGDCPGSQGNKDVLWITRQNWVLWCQMGKYVIMCLELIW